MQAHLHAVQALPGVAEPVPRRGAQQVLFREAPELEHVGRDLAPEAEGLQNVGVLPLVVVRQPRAVAACMANRV